MTSQIGRTRSQAHWRTLGLATLEAVVLGVILVAPVIGHSELVTPTPADGATVAGDPPPTISGTYSETLDPDGSSLVLEDASGKTIATGGVADASKPTKEMAIEAVPVLAPGTYTVKSTTKSAEDGDLDRKTWAFTVEAAASPSAASSPSNAPTPSAQPSASASAAATPGGLSSSTPVGTEGDTAPPTQPASSTSDVILPIVVALVIVLGVAAYLLSRRGRPPTTP